MQPVIIEIFITWDSSEVRADAKLLRCDGEARVISTSY